MKENQKLSMSVLNASNAIGPSRPRPCDHETSSFKVEINETGKTTDHNETSSQSSFFGDINNDNNYGKRITEKSTTREAEKAPTWLNSCIAGLTNWIPLMGTGHGRILSADHSGRINTLFGFTALVCVVLLCLYVVSSGRSMDSSSIKRSDDSGIYFRTLSAHIPIALNQNANPVYSWDSIGNVFRSSSDITRLHIKVNEQSMLEKTLRPQVTMKLNENSILISGRPSYCLFSDSQTPEDVVAPYTTHLNISEMADCHHYTKLILSHWRFPKLRHIRFHNMLIREQEFRALTTFIDRHNQTLHRVEIDDCFLCPSPICDAGLINFPDHDFQITITRRRNSPRWI